MEQAAWRLLTSSGTPRYTRMAQLSAREMFPEMDDTLRAEVTERVLLLVPILARNTERTEDEFEVAVLIAALAHHHREVSLPLLQELGGYGNYPCLAWLAGEARMLLTL